MSHVVMVVQNLSVPEDRRTWLQARSVVGSGHAVTVVCPALHGHAPGERLLEGVNIVYVSAFEGDGLVGLIRQVVASTWRTTRAVKALPAFDVLQVCTPPDSLSRLLRWARRRGARTVYDQHDVVPLLAETKTSQRPLVFVHRWLERATVEHAQVIVTAGDEQARRLRATFGVEPVVIRTAAADTAARHVAREMPQVLGYVGVMGSQDGVEGLVKAMALLRQRGCGIVLRLAGDGAELPRLRALAHDLGLDNVEFVGWLGAQELESFVTEVDAIVVPDPLSEFNHTCPMLKVSHALAQGVPVIVTPLRENLAIIGTAGLVARGDAPGDLADAVTEFLGTSRVDRAQMGAALRERFDQTLAWPLHELRYFAALGVSTTAR